MKNRSARRIVALALGAVLLLSACGTSDEVTATPTPTVSTLDDVEVVGDPGTKPTLTFTAPFTTTVDGSRIVSEGTGEVTTAESLVSLHLVVYSGADATELSSSWEGAPLEAMLDGTELPASLTEALLGQKIGTRLLFSQPQTSQTDGSVETVLFGLELLSSRTAPARAEGEAVTPAEGLPTVTLDETGEPSITIPEGFPAPTELVAQTLIKGTGAVVESEQAVTVHYTGWLLADGTEFDSSWGGTQLTTAIGVGSVIDGWDQGLVGQTVGSQVLLVIPAALAYGADGNESIPGGADLVFVVDILRAG